MSRLTDHRTCMCGTDVATQHSVLGALELETAVLPLPHGLPDDQVRYAHHNNVITAHATHRNRCPLTTKTRSHSGNETPGGA